MQFFNEQIRAQPLFSPPCASATYGSARICRRKKRRRWFPCRPSAIKWMLELFLASGHYDVLWSRTDCNLLLILIQPIWSVNIAWISCLVPVDVTYWWRHQYTKAFWCNYDVQLLLLNYDIMCKPGCLKKFFVIQAQLWDHLVLRIILIFLLSGTHTGHHSQAFFALKWPVFQVKILTLNQKLWHLYKYYINAKN